MKWTAPLAVVVAGQLLLGVVGAAVVERPAPSNTRDAIAASDAPRVPSVFDLEIVRISQFVETSRGHKFKRPVKAVLLEPAAFARKLDGEPSASDADFLALSQTLGLVPPDVTVRAVPESVDVDGFYEFSSKTLYVRGTELTPYTRYVAAHELTHALQDQHFNTSRLATMGKADESDLGLLALAEGDAMRVADAYYASLPVDEQKQIDAIEDPDSVTPTTTATTVPPNQPPPWPGDRGVEYAELFPYAVGPHLVDRLVKKGGQTELDKAFINPPTSTEQMVFLNDAKVDEQPLAVPTPPADGPVFDEGPMGVFNLQTLFYSQWTSPGFFVSKWSGGRYVAWKQPDNSACIRFTVHMDTGYDASMLVDNLQLVADFHGRATVTGPKFPQPVIPYDQIRNAPVTYTACGPPKSRTWPQAQSVLAAIYNRNMAASWKSGGYSGTPPRYQPQPFQPLPRVTWMYRS